MLGHNLVLKQAADSLPSHIDGSAGLILQSGFLNLFLTTGRGMLTGWKIVEAYMLAFIYISTGYIVFPMNTFIDATCFSFDVGSCCSNSMVLAYPSG